LGKIPTSLFGRGTKILAIAGKVALEEVSSRFKTWEDEKEKLKSKIELAQEIVKTLSQLKGASMKVGQLLSLDLGDYLPPEMVKVLEELHQKSTYLEYARIEEILKSELGEKFHHFTDISPTPIAAASIGQVHQAKLEGKCVVIKVQYPGVAESIPSDLKLLELLLKQAGLIYQKSQTDITPFMEEVRDVLTKEADYVHELTMHELYREKIQFPEFKIPEVYRDYSTKKVLTQEFIKGRSFSEWLKTNPDLSTKKRIGDELMRLYLEEFFTHGLVQTDPNPGNFLITSENSIALLDFGAVKIYGSDFVEGYRRILISSYQRDSSGVLQESFKMGLIDSRESAEAHALYLEMMDFLIDPFRREEMFDFGDKSFFEKSRDLSWEMTKKCRYSPPPKDLIFLHRKLAGIFIFLKRLEIRMKLKDYWHYIEGR
jgi:aarF domain-containing kinase